MVYQHIRVLAVSRVENRLRSCVRAAHSTREKSIRPHTRKHPCQHHALQQQLGTGKYQRWYYLFCIVFSKCALIRLFWTSQPNTLCPFFAYGFYRFLTFFNFLVIFQAQLLPTHDPSSSNEKGLAASISMSDTLQKQRSDRTSSVMMSNTTSSRGAAPSTIDIELVGRNESRDSYDTTNLGTSNV